MTFSPIVTIFYSNYSSNCKALLQFIKNANIMDKLSIKFIHVDNSAIKEIVLKKFSVVPSMVVIMDDEMSLYTGDNVFEWFNIYDLHLESAEPPNSLAEAQPKPRLEPEAQPRTKTILEIAAELSKAREEKPSPRSLRRTEN